MSSIGKITSSLLSIPTELTIAAANLNFDFSLLKVEAPKEFHGVRDALSQARREKAESGLPHVTARKLGALFEPLVPPIPNLVSAYGQRVSEISAKLSGESSSSPSSTFGIFSSQAGPDATNIWAAATSGRGAIAVQLLACMLARIWDEAQAISLWVELVEGRIKEVKESTIDGNNVAALMAAQQTFSRDQLAAWDSSARSWIKTADAERKVQQTQLMLIISNIQLPVNSSQDLYESVIRAWRCAMTAMEKLVQGIPQQIRDGSILLAISAWHLYPDMAVLSEVLTRVEQHDPLMNGSLLTFSVHISPANEESEGVFWSLPMAHMRYYSTPVVAHGRVNSDKSRVSMDEFLIVVLGRVISPWLRSFCSDTSRCCQLVRLIWDVAKRANQPHNSDAQDLDWLYMLAGAAARYLGASGILGQQYHKLLSLGIRSRGEFFGSSRVFQDPAFGLTSFKSLLGLINDELVEEKIQILRDIAQSLEANSDELLIKYISNQAQINQAQIEGDRIKKARQEETRIKEAEMKEAKISQAKINQFRMDQAIIDSRDYGSSNYVAPNYEFASAVPVRRGAQEASGSSKAHSVGDHRRWVLGWRDGLCTDHNDFPTTHDRGDKCGPDCGKCFNKDQRVRIEALGEEWTWFSHMDIHHSHDRFRWTPRSRDIEPMRYSFVLGDWGSFSIYQSERCQIHRQPDSIEDEDGKLRLEYRATIQEVEAILRSPYLSLDLLLTSLDFWLAHTQMYESLTAMVFASTLYQGLPGATVSLEVLKMPQLHVGWAPSARSPSENIFTLPNFFSCIATFESGRLIIGPESLKRVMAMSSYDSIFVASALLSDPIEDNCKQPIRRVFGNIGRSEMAFMVPVADPRFKEADAGSWQMINHLPFDGQLLDSFKGTSLHLSLTDFELTLDVGVRGLRDRNAVLLESVITVKDKGKDIGDLDILAAYDSELITRAEPCKHHPKAEEHEAKLNSSCVSDPGVANSHNEPLLDCNLTSLDCWDEFLDPPLTSKSIFRSTGNWQARLAAVAACEQDGQRVLLLPQNPCLRCIAESGYELDEFDVLVA